MFYEEIRVGLSYSPKLRLTVAAEVDIYSRRKKQEARSKKQEAITSRVSAIKNVLTGSISNLQKKTVVGASRSLGI